MLKILPLDVGTHDCAQGRSQEILGRGAELYIYSSCIHALAFKIK
jgi:hypothetical protein